MSGGVPLISKPGVDPPIATMSDWHTLSPPEDLYRSDVKGQHRESVEVMQPTAVVEGDVVVEESGGQEQAAASEIGALSEEPQKKRKKNTERRKEKLLAVVLLLLLVMARVKRRRQFPVRLSASSLMLEPVPNTSICLDALCHNKNSLPAFVVLNGTGICRSRRCLGSFGYRFARWLYVHRGLYPFKKGKMARCRWVGGRGGSFFIINGQDGFRFFRAPLFQNRLFFHFVGKVLIHRAAFDVIILLDHRCHMKITGTSLMEGTVYLNTSGVVDARPAGQKHPVEMDITVLWLPTRWLASPAAWHSTSAPVTTMSDWHTLSPPEDLNRSDAKGQHRGRPHSRQCPTEQSVEVMQQAAVVKGDVVVEERGGQEQTVAGESGALSEGSSEEAKEKY
ncbi:hypothetical protein T12_7069 [Trichinella patagoniensis]|uniref:Uncharacterized protein n=2 Tax=Trichinella TaxID=6333 RepID=A0A0V1AEE0_9BILA|nr:hypothetical protein T12_7069 [Trichinella patagoniensis]